VADDPEKPPLPEPLKVAVAGARRRHQARWPAPEIAIVPREEGWSFESPYSDEDGWWKLIGDAFGTCSKAVVDVFVGQLAMLVGTRWIAPTEEGRAGRWQPEEAELMAAMSIVASLKPKNEAEAAFAASIVATHFASMKLGAEIARRSYPDARTIASLAAINRAYAQQMDAFHRMRGRGNNKRQTIIVKKETRYYDNRQVHLGEGAGKAGNRADGARELRAGARGAAEPEVLPALPSPDEGAQLLRFPGGEGQERLPAPRRSEGQRRTKGAG
jgi:hypothetical protein